MACNVQQEQAEKPQIVEHVSKMLYYDEKYKAVYENVYAKANLTCSANIEILYYSAGNDLICIYCGAEDRFKVNPGKYLICEPCIGEKLLPVDERKKTKKGRKMMEMLAMIDITFHEDNALYIS